MAMHYTKEKNILKIYVDGTNGFYKWDIATAVFYGKRGNPLMIMPCKGDIHRMFGSDKTHLGNVINRAMDMRTARADEYNAFINRFAIAEKLDGMKVPYCRNISLNQYEYIEQNFNDFVKYVKETKEQEGFGTYDWYTSNFKCWVVAKKAKQNGCPDDLPPDMVDCLTEGGRRELNEAEWSAAVYYLVRGKMWEYHGRSCGKLFDYFNLCKKLEKTPQKVNNFMREWWETKNEYELRKTELDNNALRKVYEERKEAFTFAFGNYVVVVPSSCQDIIDEGVNMHHCVGRYVDAVVCKRTYIVFVRHKDTPKQCYITAEISTDGKLGQYYLAYDRYIHSTEDCAFRDAFQKHLMEVWNR